MEEIKQQQPYEKLRITSDTPRKPIEPMLWIDGNIVLTRGNVSVMSGQAKSKKTFFLRAVVKALITGEWCGFITGKCHRVAWFDTEQAEADAGNVFDSIVNATGTKNCMDMFYLRGLKGQEMIDVFVSYVKQNTTTDFIVIDGIGDFMNNPNCIEESTRIRDLLMNLTQEHNIHIICVLHVNYDSPKLRGHLGSELERKSEHTFSLKKQGEATTVEARLSRRKAYDEFNFIIKDGFPVTGYGGSPIDVNNLTPMQEALSKNSEDFYKPTNDEPAF